MSDTVFRNRQDDPGSPRSLVLVAAAITGGVCAAVLILCQGIPEARAASPLDWLGLAGKAPLDATLADAAEEAARSTAANEGRRTDIGAGAANATSPAVTVAVHVTPEGHFEFAVPSGGTYTAGTPAELSRAGSVVASGSAAGLAGVDAILTTASLFAGPEALKLVPAFKSLRVAVPAGGATTLYPVERRADGLAVRVTRHLALVTGSRRDFHEALAQLRRSMSGRQLEVLSALEPVTEQAPRVPPPASAAAVPVVVADVDRLAVALAGLPRKTVILVAKVARPAGADGDAELRIEPQSGRTRSIAASELAGAARSADADLVILDTDPPRQPGGRTWLWRGVSVANADRATKAATFADVLTPLAEARGGFDIRVAFDASGGVRLDAEPSPSSSSGWSGWLGAASEAADAVTFELMGSLKPKAVHAFLVAEERRRELASRLIPQLPSSLQFAYGALVLTGLAGWRTARVWWRGIWRNEKPSDYASRPGWLIARAIRFAAFLALFLPVAGLAAAVVGALRRKPRRPVSATA